MPVWATVAIGVVIAPRAGRRRLRHVRPRRRQARCSRASTRTRDGQREVAVSAFNKAAREDPKAALPHMYLARMAREVGNFTLASQELQLALQAEPANPIALREMGANLLAQNNYELARRFYVRAVQADPTDKTAQGYLGCTLMKLGRRRRRRAFSVGPGRDRGATVPPLRPLPVHCRPRPGRLTGTAPRP